MKYLFILFLLLSLVSCKSEKDPIELPKNNVHTPNINANLHQEFYKSGKIKIEGPLNYNGRKTGKWISYFENGNKLSESTYKKGINNGYSIVWYPNGKVRYLGDYKNGEKSGEWSFYNESGELNSERTY